MLPILYLLIALFTYPTAKADYITPLTRMPVQPYAINQGYVSDYAFHVSIPSEIDYNGYIIVEFPASIQLSGTCDTYIKYQSSSYIDYPCTKTSSNVYSIQVGTILAGNYEIIVTGVQNPRTDRASSAFKISTWVNGLVLVDSNERLPGVPFSPAAGSSLNASVTNIGYSNVNLGSKFNFKFSLKKKIPVGGSIKFNFPVGFSLVKPACYHKNSGSYAIATTLYNNRMVLCQQFEYEFGINMWHEVLIIGVTNPDHTGYYRPLSLETFEGTTPNVLEVITLPAPVQIIPGNIQTTITSGSNLLVRNTTHQFDFIPDDPIPSDTDFWIKFPSGFRYQAANCTLARDLEPAVPGGTVSCGMSKNGTGYVLSGFKDISAKTVITIIFTVENPAVSTNYKIQAFTFSNKYQSTVDEVFKFIYIETRFGSAKFFKSHALLFTRRLNHNEIGPLEFTFFLTVPLPATTGTFLGKIMVDIRPQLAYPPGVLQCFFYGDVPATSCTWDTSMFNRTRVTLTTPANMPYYQTEMPITITSEDSVGNLGVQLLPLIQRYKFYIYFYQNLATTEHEVYFEDYVPNPIYMDNTWITAGLFPVEYYEYGYLRIDFTNRYMDLGSNYFIMLEFDHSTAGWDWFLGWPNIQWYQINTVPCIVVGLSSTYRCTLRPGNYWNTFSLIKIWSIGPIPNNTNVQIHIPKIQMGYQQTAKMAFVLYENTPCQNSTYIPILVQNFTFTNQNQFTTSTNTFNTLSLANNKPDATSILTLAMTSSAVNPEYIIYDMPSQFIKDTGITSCTGGTCIYFGAPCYWLVFQPSPAQGTAASTGVSILSAPYEGTYTFGGRTSQALRIKDRKSQTYYLPPGAIVINTWTTDASNPEINRNSLVLFDLAFTLATKHPADWSIKITFTNLVVPTGTDLYCQVVSGISGFDTRDVTCEYASSNVLKIYNLAAVPISTFISLTLQLWTGTATGVSALINTYYERSSTNRVDTATTSTLTLSFNYDNFFASQMFNDRSGELIRVNTAGKITLNYVTQLNYTLTSNYIVFTFDTGFATASGTTTDVLLCRMNNVRRACTYTLSPLRITVTGLGGLAPMTSYQFILTTEYESPAVRGIRAPSSPGYYTITAELYDGSGFIVETVQDFIYVFPAPTSALAVTVAHLTASVASMYTFQFSLQNTLPSNTASGTRGRIYLDFPVGTNLFLADLGTGLVTGNAIGCNIQGGLSPATSIRCRIICSPGNNLRASIELTGFNAVTSVPTADIFVRILQIKNPTSYVGEMTFAVRTETVSVTTGLITPVEFRQVSIWIPVVSTAWDTNSYSASANPTFESGSYPGYSSRYLTIYQFTKYAMNAGDHYLYTLPTTIQPTSTIPCPAVNDLCLYFADTNTILYRLATSISANTNVDGTINYVTLPSSYSVSGYTIPATIWINSRMSHQVTHTITAAHMQTLVGPISSASFALVDPNQLNLNRDNTDIVVTFTTFTNLPSTGSIMITFPTGTTPKMGCRNAPTVGSQLTTSTGHIACAIQSNSWVITNFNTLVAGSTVKIYGQVQLANSAGTTASGAIYTFGNQNSNLAANGMWIDWVLTGLTFTLPSYSTFRLDASPTFRINRLTRATGSNYQPLVIDFNLRSLTITTSRYFLFGLPYSGGSYFTGGVFTNAQYSCWFQNLATSVVISGNCGYHTVSGGFIYYYAYPLQNIGPTINYRFTLTTVNANNGLDGIIWPNTLVESDLLFWAFDGSTYEVDCAFFEVYPQAFTSATVRSYILQQSTLNIIDVLVTGTFATSHRIIVEFPTLFNSTAIWQEDLGLGHKTYDLKICEWLSSSPVVSFSCMFERGNTIAGSPARVILYGISATATSIRFAFTVMNPAVSISTVLPVAVYVQIMASNLNLQKVFYQYFEDAIPVLASAAPAATVDSSGISWGSTTVGTATTLTMAVKFTSTLTPTDAYVINIPEMGDTATSTATTVTFGSVTWNLIYMPRSMIIVLIPQSSIGAGTYTFTTPGSIVYTNDFVLLSASMPISATATYFSTYTFQRTTYTNTAPLLTARTSFPSSASVTVVPSTTLQRQYSSMTISITTIFRYVTYIRIDIPSQFTVGVDCVEASGSAIDVVDCTIDSSNNRILVTTEAQSSASNQILRILLNDLYAATSGTVSNINYFLYFQSKSNTFTDTSFSVYEVSASPSLSITANSFNLPTYVEFGYLPFVENYNTLPSGTYGELTWKWTPDVTISPGFILRFTYPTYTNWINWDGSTYEDCSPFPMLIICNPNDITTSFGCTAISAGAAPSGGQFSFTIPSGLTLRTPYQNKMRLTISCKRYPTMGFSVTSNYGKVPFYFDISNGASYIRTGILTYIYTGPASSTLSSMTLMHRIPSTTTGLRYIGTPPSGTDSMFIEFPIYDQTGNPSWDYDLGLTQFDVLPCAVDPPSYAVSSFLKCVFLGGSNNRQDPPTIWIRGFQSLGGVSITVYLFGFVNPAASTNVGWYIRFYSANTMIGHTFVNEQTIASSGSLSTQSLSSSYYVTANRVYPSTGTTFTFRTGVSIASGYILVSYDNSCSFTSTSGQAWDAIGTFSGTTQRYFFMTTTAVSAGGYYSTTYLQCNFKTLYLQFTGYHITSSTSGEVRTSELYMSQSTVNSLSGVNVASTGTNQILISGFEQGSSSTFTALINLDYSNIASKFSWNSNYILYISYTNLYFDTLLSCSVIRGLLPLSPNRPISCTISSNMIKITNFIGVDTGTTFVVRVTYNSASSYSTGIIQSLVYGDSTTESNTDYSFYSQVSISAISINSIQWSYFTYTTPTFSPTPQLNVANQYIDMTIPQWNFPTAINPSGTLRIVITFRALAGTVIVSGSTTCSRYTSTYYTSCTVGTNTLTLNINMAYWGNGYAYAVLPDTVQLYNVQWIDLIGYFITVEVRDSSWYYYSSRSNIYMPSSSSMSVSVSPLSNTFNVYNEWYFSLNPPLNINKFTALTFDYTSSTSRALNYGQVDCVCSVSSSVVGVSCYKYTTTSIDFVFSSQVSAGASLVCYLPDMMTPSSENIRFQIQHMYLRTVYYQSSTYSFSFSSLTSTTHNLYLNLPSNPLTLPAFQTVTVQMYTYYTVYSSTIYIDVGNAGNNPPTCSNLNLCRSYSAVRRIYVAPFGDVYANNYYNIYSTAGGYGYYYSDQNANYTVYSYLLQSSNYVYSYSNPTGSASTYRPQAISLSSEGYMSEYRQGFTGIWVTSFTLPASIQLFATVSSVGGRVVYVLTGPTSVSSCLVFAHKFLATCSYSVSGSTTTITITFPAVIPASSVFDVILRLTVPGTTPSVQITAFSYYDGSATDQTQIAATQSTTSSYFNNIASNTGTVLGFSNFITDRFFTYTVNPSSAPVRIKFELPATMSSGDTIIVTLPASMVSYSGSLVCNIRTYPSGNVYYGDLDFVQYNVSTCSISTNTITATLANSLPANIVHQLIIATTGTQFTKVSSTNLQATISWNFGGSINYRADPVLFPYLPSGNPITTFSSVGLYWTSNKRMDFNNLIFTFAVTASVMPAFPTYHLEIVFTSASGSNIKTGATSRAISCSALNSFSANLPTRSGSVNIPRCTLIYTTPPKVRIENYDQFSGSNVAIALYDVENNLIANNYYGGFTYDVVITQYSPYNKWIYHYEGMLVPIGTTATSITTITGNFPSSSVNTFRSSMGTLTNSVTAIAMTSARSIVDLSQAKYLITSTSCTLYVSTTRSILFVDINRNMLMTSGSSWSAATRAIGIGGSGCVTPYPWDGTNPGGTVTIQTFEMSTQTPTHRYVFSGGTPTTLVTDGVTAGGNCINIGSVNGMNGKVWCYLYSRLDNSKYNGNPSIDAVQYFFTTSSQFSSFFPNYCKAFIDSNGYNRGQALCARTDTSATSVGFFITGFTYNWASYVYLYFRMVAKTSATLSYTVRHQLLYNGVYYDATSSSTSLSISGDGYWTTSWWAPTTLSFAYDTNPQVSLGTSSTSPFRVALDVNYALSSGDTITFTFASSSNYQPVATSNIIQLCTMRLQTTFGMPYLTQCSYSSGTYTLTMIQSVPTGRYLVELMQLFRDGSATQGVTFPSTTALTTLTATIQSSYVDAIRIHPVPPAFSTFKISFNQDNAGTATRFNLAFTVPAAIGSDATPTSAENALILEFNCNNINGFWDTDLGASTATYQNEGIPYYNGITLPGLFSPVSGTQKANLQYGTSAFPASIRIRGFNSIAANTAQSYSIGYLKMQPVNRPMYTKFIIMSYSTSSPLPQILYEYTAWNYDNAVSYSESISSATLTMSNSFTEQATTVTFDGVYYGGTMDTNTVFYVKFKNNAANWDYTTMMAGSITCSGFTVDWQRTSYIMYLTPTAYYGYWPSITCSGFRNGFTGTVTLETGLYRYNYAAMVPYTWTRTLSVFTPYVGSTTGIDSLTATRTIGVANNYSVNTFTFTYNPGNYYFPQGSYIDVIVPSCFSVINGRTDFFWYIGGLKDGTTTSIQVTLVSGNIRIRGYAYYSGATDGNIVMQFLLMNKFVSNNQNFHLKVYTSTGTQFFQSNNFPVITVSSTPQASMGMSLISYLSDDVVVTTGQQYSLKFMVRPKTAITSAGSGQIKVRLPNSWVLQDTAAACKYSIDNATNWVRSTACVVALPDITIPVVQGFDIPAYTNFGNPLQILITTDNYTWGYGIWRDNFPTLYTFNVKTIQSGTIRESVWLSYVLLPPTGTVNPYWMSTGSNDYSIIEMIFTADQAYQSTDVFQFKLVTNNELSNMFPTSLGQSVPETRMLAACGIFNQATTIVSNNPLINCYYVQGSTSTNPQTSAQVIVRNEKNIAAGQQVWFYIANIQNPNSGDAGWEFSVSRQCRNDGMYCPIFYRRYYTTFGCCSSKSWYWNSQPTLSSSNLLVNSVTTTFSINLINSVGTTGAFVLKTPTNLVYHVTPCTSTIGLCINWPTLGWTFLRPSSTISSGNPRTVSMIIDNAQFWDRHYNLRFYLEQWSGQRINQVIESYHPNYALRVPPYTNNFTLSDYDRQYMVRNFNNIVMVNLTNIWRTALTTRVIFNIPTRFPGIDSPYCFAGVNISDMSDPGYHEFPCYRSSGRQLTFVFTDPWQPGYENSYVVVAYRGFMTTAYTTGQSDLTYITSYAHISNSWVIDEISNYGFVSSPTPTPTLRDVNMNLKSFFDLKPSIGDLVMFYGVIWPNTAQAANQITTATFQVSDDFGWPSVSSLTCSIKRIFLSAVQCTLVRSLGQTLITMRIINYDHGPFLVRITNTNSARLFTAPRREGLFLFNVTFGNSSNLMVEQADSYPEIKGPYMSYFGTWPVLNDPLTQSLWVVRFTTTNRVIPPGYNQAGQTCNTSFYLYYQTYSPAFPVDLGSGLTNNSEISCIPVSGLTVTATGKLTCTLIIGTKLIDTVIRISGYDPIQAFSTVTIYLEQIATLDINSNSRIKIQVMSSYSGDPSIYIFYNSWEVFVPTTPTAFNILNANAALTIVRTGSIVLMERSDYNFTFFVTNALTANRDYIVIEFPTNGYLLNTDYSDVRVSISDPIKTSQRYIFNWKNVIYIYPTQAITFGSVTVTVSNLPNPAYLFNSTQTYRVETIVFNKTTETYVNTMSLDTAFCALFSNIQVDYPSLFTLINENTYTFSFKVDHVIPGTGSIAIIFDPNLYVLRPSSPTCQLVSGLPSTATCVRELFSQQMMRISLNGGAIAKGTSMVVKIINVNNPTVANQAPTFTITSFYDNVQASNNIICSSTVTTTAFNAYSQITCPLSIEPGAVNAGAETEYEVTLNCADNIRNATTLKITLPTNIQGFTSNFGCTTNGNYMLSPCTNTARTSEVVLTVLKPNIQKPLIVRIKGVLQPSIIGQVPTMNVNLEQYGIQYGNTDTANSLLTFKVVSNLNQRTYTNNAKINVFPANYGERGMYFFDVGSLTFNTEPSSFRLIFDTNFNKVVGTDLECGTFTPASAYQGASFAMNYEVMANWVLFTCTVIDDYVINVQYPSTITFKDKPNSDFNFYVEGIINPASGTSFTFKFNFYDSNKAIVLISSTTVTLQFDPPPSMLRLSSVSSTDNNVLSVNNYTFVINTTYSLPFSVTTGNKDYELVVKFPAAQYPSFTNYRTPISYSFSRQSLNTGSAFNFKNSIYFYANYPDLSLISPLSLTMSNITNPSSRTDCSFGSTTSLSFEVQYVSRTMGKIYAKTYPAMDQSNCLTLTKTRYSIEASTSYLMVRGLSYPLTINVEQAATGLRLVPYSRYLIFSPTEVNFTNFLTSTATINIIVPADLPVGEYVIRWQKYETNNPPRYLDVPDTKVSIAPSTVLAPLAIVSIETFNYVWTGSLARDVMVTLSQDPASEVIVTINLRNADSKVQSSLDNVVFSDFPVSLRFVRGETRKRFYIWAEAGASSNYLTITLSGANSDVYNPNIQEYPFMIMTPLASGSISVVNSQILNIYENSATARISISSIGTIYYAAIIKSGSHVPQVSELLNSKFKDMDKKWYNAGAVSVEALGDGNSYSVTFNLTGLYSQTSYSLFCIARSTSGQYSNISNVTFTTLKVSPGASIRIPTSASIDTSVLGVALSNILSIPASRIIFKSAQVFTDTAQSQITGTTYNTYTFIIAPDPTNNSPSAIELANEITGGAAAVNLKSLVPTFYSNLGVKVAQVVHIPPKVLSSPKIIDVGYYTLSITMELIEEGKGYALVTENNTVGNTKPTSYQIAHGLLADNSQAENRYWIAAPSDVNGFVQITFDELKDNTYYNIYITAANNIPYEPADLLDDSSVIVLSTTTLENPNLGDPQDLLDKFTTDSNAGWNLQITLWILIVAFLLIMI